MYFRLLTALAGLLMCASYAAAFPIAYVANLGDSTVSVIDTKTNKYITKIPLGDGQEPFGVAVSSDGKRVYVSNQAGNTISVIDALTDPANPTVINTINLGSISPRGLAIYTAGARTYLYVTSYTNASVSVFDVSALPPNTTVTPTAIASPTVQNNPTGIAIAPYISGGTYTGTFAYVTNFDSGTVSAIDVATNTTSGQAITLGTGTNPMGIAVGTKGAAAGKIYVAHKGSGTGAVSVIDASTRIVTTIPNVGSNPYGIAVAPDGSNVFVTNALGDTVAAINTTTNAITTYTLPQYSMPQGIAVAPDGLNVYAVTHRGDDNMGSVARILLSAPPATAVSYLKNQPDSINPDFVNFFNAPLSLGNFIGPQLYTIATTAGSNGSVTSPEGKIATNGSTIGQIVEPATTAQYTITPSNLYRVDSITINGSALDLRTDTRYDKIAKTLTLTSISDDLEINVTFIKDFDYVSVSRAAAAGAPATADGTVTSSVGMNSTINCSASTSPSLCNALFQEGVTVTLTATPNNGYYFAGWVGDTSKSGSSTIFINNGQVCDGNKNSVCTFTMTTYTHVTATFTNVAPGGWVKMVPQGTYFPSDTTALQDAINAITSTTTELDLVQPSLPLFAGGANFNNTSAGSIILSGGWLDKQFSGRGTTPSTISSLTITKGTITVDNIAIK